MPTSQRGEVTAVPEAITNATASDGQVTGKATCLPSYTTVT